MAHDVRRPTWASLREDVPAADRLAAVLFDPGPVTELRAALTALAERLREALDVDVAALMVSEDDPLDMTMGMAFRRPDDDAALRPLLESGSDLGGLGGEATWTGASVVWPRLAAEPTILDRLGQLRTGGGEVRTALDLLDGASGLGVPLASPNHPRLGAVVLISLDPRRPLGAVVSRRLEEVAPQVSLTVRNHQLRDRNRRTRQVLEAVLESTHNGIVVTDLAGRITIANRAASQLIAVDLSSMIGQPMREVVAEHLRWRFADAQEYVRSTQAIYDDPQVSVADEVQTVDGRVIERYTAPVRDTSGALLGRVEILTDVTAAQEALEDARRLAEEAAQLRLSEERRSQEEMALARAAHLMASALTRADIHEHLLDQAAEVTGAEAAGVMVVDRSGEVTVEAVRGMTEAALERMGLEAGGEGLVGRVLAGRRPFICSDVDAEGVRTRISAPPGVRSFVLAPLLLGDRVYGLLLAGSPRARAFGERELRLAGELARHAGAALQNAMQYEQERHIAETLQHALLPDDLPSVPGLAIAGLYRAAAGAQVGGDFYGVWTLPAGQVAVLVGDVSGKGVEAAGTTAMVRYVAEGMTAYESDPGRVVTALNARVTDRIPDGSFVTLVLAVIDPLRDEIAWSSAGHVTPLVVSGGGAVIALEDVGPPAGVFPRERYVTSRSMFEPGDTLVCVTDGVVEARREGEEFGDPRLREVLRATLGASPREIAKAVYAAVAAWSDGRIADDVAIAVVTRRAR